MVVTTTKTPSPTSNNQVAERLGCDHTTVSRLRAGKRVPSLKLAVRISEVYELSKDDQADFFAAMAEGPKACGRFLTERVFGSTVVSG